jgi:hypothetical protein
MAVPPLFDFFPEAPPSSPGGIWLPYNSSALYIDFPDNTLNPAPKPLENSSLPPHKDLLCFIRSVRILKCMDYEGVKSLSSGLFVLKIRGF